MYLKCTKETNIQVKLETNHSNSKSHTGIPDMDVYLMNSSVEDASDDECEVITDSYKSSSLESHHVYYHNYAYDIAYHPTFEVPVMYFRAQRKRSADAKVQGSTKHHHRQYSSNGGEYIDADEVLRDLLKEQEGLEISEVKNEGNEEGLLLRQWAFIAHCEHPVTGIPCFMLHPCRTNQMIQEIKQSQKQSDKQQTDNTDKHNHGRYQNERNDIERLASDSLIPEEGKYVLLWFSAMSKLVKCTNCINLNRLRRIIMQS